MHLRPADGPRLGLMKCASCIYVHSRSRLATIGCRLLQYFFVKDHERSHEHILSIPIWEARDKRRGEALMDSHVDNMINREYARIIICMKILYFTIQNDKSILSYEDICQLLRDLHTPEMPVNDDYGAYTSKYAALMHFFGVSTIGIFNVFILARSHPFIQFILLIFYNPTLNTQMFTSI